MLTLTSTILLLGVLIFVHELGHFLAAKALGVRVERFSLGFPPKLVGRKIGETEYVLSWIPLGGYVKMFGENPEEVGSVPKEEEGRSFSHKPTWARFLIVLAGPGFNFVFAFLIFWAMFAVEGIPHLTSNIGKVKEDMPAAEVGLKADDKITAIDGRPVKFWDDVLTFIRESEGRTITITVQRGRSQETVSLKPKMMTSKNIFGEDTLIPMIGIEASAETVIEKIDPATAFYHGALKTWDLTRLTILSVVKLIQGKLSAKTLGGPIFIAQIAGQQAQAGLVNLIFLAALLSLNLGILNLLPVPILDGGHLFFFLLEFLFRRPLSLRVRERAQQLGLVLLIVFMAFVFYNDLERIFKGDPSPSGSKAPTQQHERSRP